MDLVDLGCNALRADFLEPFMTVIGYFGHGLVGGTVALLLLAHGYFYKNPRTKWTGVAIIVALIIAGTLAQALKEIVQLPRPKLRSSHGFPSGHESAAFGFAAVLATAFPTLAPIFYLLAILTGLSRMYFRAHFTWDVIGGALIGLAVGIPVARKLIPDIVCARRSAPRVVAWTVTYAVAIVALLFFHTIERNIETALSVRPGPSPAASVFDFGTPQARKSLDGGWHADEFWDDVKQSVVWANGLKSDVALELPNARDYRFRLTVFPYSPKGPACQRVEIKLNEKILTKLVLEQGWHSYEFSVPAAGVHPGRNNLEFAYAYAESPVSRGRGADRRLLSVAFDKLEIF